MLSTFAFNFNVCRYTVDLKIHKSLFQLNESPVYMLFNPRADLGGARLPPDCLLIVYRCTRGCGAT